MLVVLDRFMKWFIILMLTLLIFVQIIQDWLW